MEHNEHCRDCKSAVEALLRAAYGSVEKNYRFSLGVKPEDYWDYQHFGALRTILAALESYRGFKNFIRAPYLPEVDYLVLDPGFILEFDESQHFTLPRKITLEHYPRRLELGFSPERWIALCASIDAKDDEPPFRDEARAWYDMLRDFAPAVERLRPTVRLYAGAMQWCALNPDDPGDLSMFQALVERR